MGLEQVNIEMNKISNEIYMHKTEQNTERAADTIQGTPAPVEKALSSTVSPRFRRSKLALQNQKKTRDSVMTDKLHATSMHKESVELTLPHA